VLPNHGRPPYQSRFRAGIHQAPKQSPGARMISVDRLSPETRLRIHPMLHGAFRLQIDR
jgi:hypothetical protein